MQNIRLLGCRNYYLYKKYNKTKRKKNNMGKAADEALYEIKFTGKES